MAPSQIQAAWVRTLGAEREIEAISEAIAASGLLPSQRIGPPPAYDRCGRQRKALPPTLRRIHEAAPAGRPTNLPEVWQALSAAQGIELPDDPTADEVLAPATWRRVRMLPASHLGISDRAWRVYLQRAHAALLPHATVVRRTREADSLPEFLRGLATKRRKSGRSRHSCAAWKARPSPTRQLERACASRPRGLAGDLAWLDGRPQRPFPQAIRNCRAKAPSAACAGSGRPAWSGQAQLERLAARAESGPRADPETGGTSPPATRGGDAGLSDANRGSGAHAPGGAACYCLPLPTSCSERYCCDL